MTLLERGSTALVLATGLLFIRPVVAQAPASPERPWAIPDSASARAAQLGDHREPVPQKQYGLAELIDLAERTNPQTREAWEAARAAAAAEGLVESQYLPQLSFEALGGYEHTPLPAPKSLIPKGFFESNTQEFIPSLALKWLLFDFGRRAAALEGARADSFTANVAFTGAHQAVIFGVSQAYFDLGAARGRLHAAQKALSTAQTTQDATLAKRHNGLATVVSVAQAERQTAQTRYNVTAAEGVATNAMANLVATLGVAAETELDVLDSAEFPLPPAPEQNVQAAIQHALAHRPDVLAALGQVDSAEASLKGARRARYPVISVSAHAFQNMGAVSSDGKPYSGIDRPGANILLSFSVPIFDGGMRSSQISIARAKVREAEAKLDNTRDSAAQQVVKAYNGLLTSLAEHNAATALSEAAHTAYDAALRSYGQGVGTYTDLATEENAVVQAETQVEDARASAHTAAAALAFAMGAIGNAEKE
ncbi:MAG: TolC family protein [Gammaproteobacteria bacterium]|nr:TolC family protein [Gammaproteobacteria bacterium]